MQKTNIFRQMYKFSPMNFYTINENSTTIKSINNTSLGYEFDKAFTTEEVKTAWSQFKLHKRISTILIFLLFILFLYEFIFPQYSFLVNNSWYVNAVMMLIVLGIVCQIITLICTKIFERNIEKKFGIFKKVKFIPSENIDPHYYKLFKIEVIKVLALLAVLAFAFSYVSPFYCAKRLLIQERYKEAVKYTTIGTKIFPIAQEWYSMRGYANYKLGNYKDAIKDFDKAYKLGADGFNIMNFDNKIFIKYTLKDYNGALKDFDKEIRRTRNSSEKDEFLWDKAQFLYNIGKYEDALAIYSDLIDKAENDRIYLLKDRLYYERAQVYKNLGQQENYQKDMEASGVEDTEEILNPIPKPSLILDEETIEIE
jgi:hypothetical protein